MVWSHERGGGAGQHDIVFRSQMGLKSFFIFIFLFPIVIRQPVTRNLLFACFIRPISSCKHVVREATFHGFFVAKTSPAKNIPSFRVLCFLVFILFLFYFFFFPLCLQCIITFSEFCSYLHANAWPPDRADNPRASYLVIYL